MYVQRSNECTYIDQMNAQIDKWGERGVVDRKGSLRVREFAENMGDTNKA